MASWDGWPFSFLFGLASSSARSAAAVRPVRGRRSRGPRSPRPFRRRSGARWPSAALATPPRLLQQCPPPGSPSALAGAFSTFFTEDLLHGCRNPSVEQRGRSSRSRRWAGWRSLDATAADTVIAEVFASPAGPVLCSGVWCAVGRRSLRPPTWHWAGRRSGGGRPLPRCTSRFCSVEACRSQRPLAALGWHRRFRA